MGHVVVVVDVLVKLDAGPLPCGQLPGLLPGTPLGGRRLQVVPENPEEHPARGHPSMGSPFRRRHGSPGRQVRQSVVEAVREAVEKGAAESQNAFVERALVRELQELRRQRLYDAYARAAADPVFMEEMRSTSETFEAAAGDGLAGGEG